MSEPVAAGRDVNVSREVTTVIPKHSVARAILFATLVAEISLLVAAATDRVSLVQALLAHLTVLVTMTALLWRRLCTGVDGGASLLAVIGTLATGPFGAAGALLMPLLTRRNVAGEALLPAWYNRIALSAEQDAFTRLSDRVAIGRAANLAAPVPMPFVQLFQSGPIGDQQAALGMIARAFHPGYLPVLKMALDSPEPVIRVQAAAVAARVRGQLNAQIGSLVARAADPTLTPTDAMDVAAELRAAMDSGLLEASEHATAVGVHQGLLARTFARLDARRRSGAKTARLLAERTGDDVDDAYAAHLLMSGRFDEFRAARLAVRRPTNGRYRRRLVQARPVAAAFKVKLHPVAVRR